MNSTSDLLGLRSDAYEILPDGQVRLHPDRQGQPPVIRLSDDYKLVDQLGPLGVPSLLQCRSLTVTGPVRLAPGVVCEGDVTLENSGTACREVAPGVYRDTTLAL